MPKFFMPVQDNAAQIILSGEDAHHVGYALRGKISDVLTVCNTDPGAKTYGWDYLCHITAFDSLSVALAVDEVRESKLESDVKITLYQAVPKGDKLDFIVQKAVELGANAVVPVITKRCISRPDEKAQEKKRQRLQKIALEAAKQCGRNILPQVEPFCSFAQALGSFSAFDRVILCYEGGGVRLSEALSGEEKSIALLIGSEGGFDPDEVKKAVDAGCVCCTLGGFILRCETAPVTALSILRHLTGDI